MENENDDAERVRAGGGGGRGRGRCSGNDYLLKRKTRMEQSCTEREGKKWSENS